MKIWLILNVISSSNDKALLIRSLWHYWSKMMNLKIKGTDAVRCNVILRFGFFLFSFSTRSMLLVLITFLYVNINNRQEKLIAQYNNSYFFNKTLLHQFTLNWINFYPLSDLLKKMLVNCMWILQFFSFISSIFYYKLFDQLYAVGCELK